MANQPDQVRKKNQERSKGAGPNPEVREKAPLGRDEQGGEHRECKKRRGVFVFQAEPDKEPEPKPVARLALVDGAHDAPRARDPDEGLEGVHGEPMMKREVNRRRDHGQRGQGLGESAAA